MKTEKQKEARRLASAKWAAKPSSKAILRKNDRARRGCFPTRPEPAHCECCGQRPESSLCADHDHKTGAFRGWLCRRCNAGLGLFGDTYEGVLRALRYLGETLV